jgi:release factor glutamine methyltransferase
VVKSNTRKIFFKDKVFNVFNGVYEPAEDTFLIAENLMVNVDDEVLDIGTGCGILSVISAQKANTVVALDINPEAVRCTKLNAEVNDVSDKVEVVRGDLFGPLKKESSFDVILFNAPYLPTESKKPSSWIDYAWSGGKKGRVLIDRFLAHVFKHLKPEGRILLVQSTLSDVNETLERFTKQGFNAAITAEKKVAFETITLIQAEKKHGKMNRIVLKS